MFKDGFIDSESKIQRKFCRTTLMKISLIISGEVVQSAGLGPLYQPMIFPPFSPTGSPYLGVTTQIAFL